MKNKLIADIKEAMNQALDSSQMEILDSVLVKCLNTVDVTNTESGQERSNKENAKLLGLFISSKRVEGCSEKTLKYYFATIDYMLRTVDKRIEDITTNDLRFYLANYQDKKKSSKVTIDNMRRIFSSYFSWLEDEDYILKSPVRRIHKVKTGKLVKETLTDENLEVLRDSCLDSRDLAMIDLLASTGMRVGELVKINKVDIDFHERECVVFGKGNSEREVYFDARTKIHLKQYLDSRTDDNPALFVSLSKPHNRLSIGGVEVRLRKLGAIANISKVHPHKFRRTLATMAIDKGMPIEQVQKLLGHVKIDTTMHYAMVNQSNVKIAHRKFIG
jgi:site-specific recombinase XerD